MTFVALDPDVIGPGGRSHATDSASRAACRNPLASAARSLQNARPMSTQTPRTSRSGFTTIELMLAVAVVAILVAVAAPGLQDFIQNMRLTGQANDLLTDLMLARSEATKRDVSVSVCATKKVTDAKGVATEECTDANKWEDGWMVVIDANADGEKDSGTNAVKVSASHGSTSSIKNATKGPKGAIVFTPTGFNSSGESVFTICDSRKVGRTITVVPSGRSSVSKQATC